MPVLLLCNQYNWSDCLTVSWRACLKGLLQIVVVQYSSLWVSTENWCFFRVSIIGYNCLTPAFQKTMQLFSLSLSNTKVSQLMMNHAMVTLVEGLDKVVVYQSHLQLTGLIVASVCSQSAATDV